MRFRLSALILMLAAANFAGAQCLMFNEIMINPSGNNDGNNPPNTSEWVEIYNTCDQPVDISCYVLTDGDFAVTFLQGTVIPAGSYFVVGSSNSDAPVDYNWATCNCTTNTNTEVGIFTNSAEQLILVDDNGGLVNAIYWGSGQFPANEISLAVPGCASQNIVFNAAGMFFESIPYSGTEDCTTSRLCDGSWSETCGNSTTPGAVNGTELVTVDLSFSDGEFCAGECISFFDQSQGATGWEWTFYGAEVTTSTEQNPSGICYPDAGFFGVQLEISSNCGPATIFYQNIIEVLPAPNPVISPSGEINVCDGDEITLTTTGTGAFQWMLNDTDIPLAVSSQFTPTESGVYTVTVTSGECSATSEPVTVTIAASGNVVINPSESVTLCEGTSIQFSTDDIFDSYQWLLNGIAIPGANASSFEATEAGEYSVLITVGNCESESPATMVSVVPQPDPLIVQGVNVEFCVDEPTTLTLNEVFDSYQWFYNAQPIANGNTASLLPLQSGNYSVEVSNDGCIGSTDITLVSIHDVTNPIIVPGQDITTCEATSLLTANSTGSIQWYYNGTEIPGETATSLTATQDGAYYFSAYLHPACPRNSQEIEVSLNVPLELDITTSSDTACDGDMVELIALGNYSNIVWNTGQDSDVIFVGSTGQYIATATDNFCVAIDTAEIIFNELPVVVAPEDFDSPCTEFLLLSGAATGDATWSVDGIVIATEPEANVLAPDRSTTYVLSSQIDNCKAADSVRVEVDCVFIYAPNAFTPDGDGINDVFKVTVSGIPFYYLRIFDRWGTVVFETDDPNGVWTGGVDEYFVPDGVYVWRIDALDSQMNEVLDKSNRTGTVLILR